VGAANPGHTDYGGDGAGPFAPRARRRAGCAATGRHRRVQARCPARDEWPRGRAAIDRPLRLVAEGWSLMGRHGRLSRRGLIADGSPRTVGRRGLIAEGWPRDLPARFF
jgi:hypothetical protein